MGLVLVALVVVEIVLIVSCGANKHGAGRWDLDSYGKGINNNDAKPGKTPGRTDQIRSSTRGSKFHFFLTLGKNSVEHKQKDLDFNSNDLSLI